MPRRSSAMTETTDTEESVINPDLNRARELAEVSEAAGVNDEDMEDMFRVSDEISATEGVRLVFVRRLPVDQKGHVGEMTPAEFTIERAREAFGPGTYSVRAIGPKGYMAGCGGKLIIAPRPKQEALSLEQILEKIDARNRQQSPGRVDILEYVKVLGPIMAPIITAILTRQPAQQPDLAGLVAALKPTPIDPIQLLAGLKQLVPQPAPAPVPEQQPDAIERALKLVEFIRDKTPVGEGESGWLDIVKEGVRALGPGVSTLLEKAGSAAAQNRPAVSSSGLPQSPNGASASGPALLPAPSGPAMGPSSATVAGALAGPDPGSEDMNLAMLRLLPWFKGRVEMLLTKAAANRAVEVWAEAFIDEFPDGIDPAPFMDLLANPQWFDAFVSFEPRVAQYREWFTEFRDYVLAALIEDQQQAEAEAAGATMGVRERIATPPGAMPQVHIRGPEDTSSQGPALPAPTPPVVHTPQAAPGAQESRIKTRKSTEIERPGPVPTDPAI